MTNYHYFSKHRRYGIVIKFAEDRYRWSENKPSQRKYLSESDYCKGAVEFYVWKNNTTYKTFESFKEYLRCDKYQDVITDEIAITVIQYCFKMKTNLSLI